jgi:hypothetical protein
MTTGLPCSKLLLKRHFQSIVFPWFGSRIQERDTHEIEA